MNQHSHHSAGQADALDAAIARSTAGGALQQAIDAAHQQQAMTDATEPSTAEILLAGGAEQQEASRAARVQRIQQEADQRNAAYAASPLGQRGKRIWDTEVARGIADAKASKLRREELDAEIRRRYTPLF